MATDPGWYPDPHDRTQARYWTGADWSDRTRPIDNPDEPPQQRPPTPLLIAAATTLLALIAFGTILLTRDDDGQEAIAPITTSEPRTTTTSTTTTTTAPTPTTGGATQPGADASGETGLQQTFDAYVEGINSGDYASAYSRLGPNAQAVTGYEEFADGNRTSQILGFSVDAVRPAGEGRSSVDVSFTSNQAPGEGPNGETCTVWNLTYDMVRGADGVWLIDRSTNRAGSPRAC